MNINELNSQMLADCEEMFFAFGLDDVDQASQLSQKAVSLMYDREIKLHQTYISTSEYLLNKNRKLYT